MATLSGEATLTTTTSFGTIDDVVLGSPIAQSHTTATKSPCAIEAVLTAPLTTDVGWQTNSNGGMSGLNRSGSFANMLGGDQEVNYTDDDYTSSEYFLTDDPITYGGGSGGSNGLYSDRFVFDFQDIIRRSNDQYHKFNNNGHNNNKWFKFDIRHKHTFNIIARWDLQRHRYRPK